MKQSWWYKFLTEYKITIVFCIVVGYMFSLRASGIFLLIIFGVILLVIYCIIQLCNVVFRKKNKKQHLVRVGLWLIPFAIGIMLQVNYAEQWKKEGNKFIQLIETFKQEHDYYPNTREDINLIDAKVLSSYKLDFRGTKGHFFLIVKAQPNYVFYYRSEKNFTSIFYKSPLTVFDNYEYTFGSKEWDFYP